MIDSVSFVLTLSVGFADVSIVQTTSPTETVTFSSTRMLIIPLSSAGSSKVALSESISAIAWSFSTNSPFSTSH